ncbi:acyl-CoA thioesterase [Novosphingobium album (ex Liu et al. 2023)]|uniref:Acyl-CoA thioesterase n=1 Tax=Novosphingobium album (ex Liu et al. 2023) TaxID=3031130 RepID=A0ABT5WNY6_9SPHN|nr:acyl-CoA thioesterase [Novosphingobium album (ex Liu et al. 2023)]MDE8651756.1 acyl-CoA thioesterase [Novosphingobium album (ex Liu et al. 2023)]
MARPEPALLDPARYPFRCAIDLRFGDLDLNMHVNNVAFAGLLEEGRVRFHRASGYRESLGPNSSVVASLAIEYLGEGRYPIPIAMHVAVLALGRTSHTLAQLLMQEDQPIVFARTVLVTSGPDGPVALGPDFRESAQRWMLAA